MNKTGKKLQNYVIKVYFSETYIEYHGCCGNIETDGHLLNISKFAQRMKEQLLKVSVP